MLMFSALDNIEEEDLKNSEYGIRAGKEGAWIEVGHRSTIGKIGMTRQIQAGRLYFGRKGRDRSQ